MHGQPGQDWKEVVWVKKAPTGAKAGDASVVAAARREGKPIEVTKKFDATNKNTGVPTNARKLEEETEVFRHDHVSHDFKIALQKARTAKGLTQQQLATLINEKVTVVNEYESGKAIPNGQIVQKLGRALGVQLPKAK
jgi:putative transcription factor